MNSKAQSTPKYHSSVAILQAAGLRPTRQRLALADWLFDGFHKHVTAEEVHAAALKARIQVSLATVYNTLNNFTAARLLSQVAMESGKVYFDTNMGDHYHLLDEDSGLLTDIPSSSIRIAALPKLPQGKILSRIDVIVRMKS